MSRKKRSPVQEVHPDFDTADFGIIAFMHGGRADSFAIHRRMFS
jgi:hypothetical protein